MGKARGGRNAASQQSETRSNEVEGKRIKDLESAATASVTSRWVIDSLYSFAALVVEVVETENGGEAREFSAGDEREKAVLVATMLKPPDGATLRQDFAHSQPTRGEAMRAEANAGRGVSSEVANSRRSVREKGTGD